VALMLGLVVVIVMRVRRQDVRWRRAAVVGWWAWRSRCAPA